MYVQGSRAATAPVREENICKTRQRAGYYARRLLGGGQSSRLSCRENYISDGIMARNAVSIATTADLVVPEYVSRAVTFRAGERVAVKQDSTVGSTETHGPGGGDPGKEKATH